MTNRILGKIVETVFCAFPGTENRFPANKARITGNPIRSSLKRMPSASRNPFTIFAFGGSQGAMGINSLLLDTLPLIQDLMPRLRIIHQTGEKDYDRVVEGYRKSGVKARIEKFIHDMPSAYAEASLLVCRAGSSTLSEIASVGRAAILVPLPYASDDHQQKNAEVFAEGGCAFVMKQLGPQAATGMDLEKVIRDLLAHPEKITEMEEAVTRFHKPNAANDIVKGLFA